MTPARIVCIERWKLALLGVALIAVGVLIGLWGLELRDAQADRARAAAASLAHDAQPRSASALTTRANVAGKLTGQSVDLHVCVLQDGVLKYVPALYMPETNDTLVDGRPFHDVYPTDNRYAVAADWYINDESIRPSTGGRYIRHGQPRSIGPEDVRPVGSYRGVVMFAEQGVSDLEYLWVPIGTGCMVVSYMRISKR